MIQKHYFRAINEPDGGEFASYAETPEKAKAQFTRNGEGYEYTRSEELPYNHTDIALAIADALSGEWEASPQSNEYAQCGWELRRDDGLTIYLSGPSYDHKTQFRFGLSAPRHNGHYVEAYDGNERLNHPVIGCGIAKTPEQMARDIERRLLPDAERVNGLVLARIASMIASENAQSASWKAVHKALGKLAADDPARRNFNGYFDGGSFEVHSGGSVTFKLYSLDADKATKLATAFRAII